MGFFNIGNEISYIEGVEELSQFGVNTEFCTNCLDFFSFDTECEVKVIKRNGNYILKSELLQNTCIYTEKEIRVSHNIHRMLVAGSFNWAV